MSEKLFEEIIVENFYNMRKKIVTQVQEEQKVQCRINPRRNRLRHILINLTNMKFKEKILKARREKQQITNKGHPIRLSGDFSTQNLQARREWQDIFKGIKWENLQPRILYLVRISFRFDGEIKSCTDNQKLREFKTTKPAWQQLLKELL